MQRCHYSLQNGVLPSFTTLYELLSVKMDFYNSAFSLFDLHDSGDNGLYMYIVEYTCNSGLEVDYEILLSSLY